jgi:hypothetical protein
MGFAKSDVDNLLARTGRMCAVCNRLHGVQVHHIKPRNLGGTDDASNMIPLCPNCHDEVHKGYEKGRTTRVYSEEELRAHLQRTVDLAGRQASYRPGSVDWGHDIDLLKFYSYCLDRPAFRTYFHQELSFADLDKALEDTELALNTGLLRTRDGMLIERSQGKRTLINQEWREGMDRVVAAVMETRQHLRTALGLDQEFMRMGDQWPSRHRYDGHRFGAGSIVGNEIDGTRQKALDKMNELLEQASLPTLKALGDWT